jgi:hypothetical protein
MVLMQRAGATKLGFLTDPERPVPAARKGAGVGVGGAAAGGAGAGGGAP